MPKKKPNCRHESLFLLCLVAVGIIAAATFFPAQADEPGAERVAVPGFPGLKAKKVTPTTDSPFEKKYPQGFAEQVAQLEKEVKEKNGLALIARIVDTDGNPVKRADFSVACRFAQIGFGGFPITPQDNWFMTRNLFDGSMGRAVVAETTQRLIEGKNNDDWTFTFSVHTLTNISALVAVPVEYGKVYYADIVLDKTPEDELISISGIILDELGKPMNEATVVIQFRRFFETDNFQSRRTFYL
jgi:hypothetical protein